MRGQVSSSELAEVEEEEAYVRYSAASRPNRFLDYILVLGQDESQNLQPLGGRLETGDTDEIQPLTDLQAFHNPKDVPKDYVPVSTPSGKPANVNEGTWGKRQLLYEARGGVCFPPQKAQAPALTGILVHFPEVDPPVPGSFRRVPGNLNKGAIGRAVHLYVERDERKAPIVDVLVINRSLSEEVPPEFTLIDKNLNEGNRGQPLYLCFRCMQKEEDREKAFQPFLLSRYPLKDYPDYSCPATNISMLCFPRGMILSDVAKLPTFFTFILTDAGGAEVYGAALICYEAMDVDPATTTTTHTDEPKLNVLRPTTESQKVFCPKCVCLLSHWPFYEGFKTFLSQVFRIFVSSSPVAIESYMGHFFHHVPIPQPGLLSVKYNIGHATIQFERPISVFFPLKNFALKPLFRYLSIPNVITLIEYILAEKQVLLYSNSFAALTPVAEALRSLLFPLKWQCVFIPVLPSNLPYILHAPVPFIVGMHRSLLEEIRAPDEIVQVDLDRNVLRFPKDEEPPPRLPEALRQCLSDDLTEHADIFTPADHSRSSLCLYLPDELLLDMGMGASGMRKINEWGVRLSFLRVFVGILGTYRRHLTPMSCSAEFTAEDAFDTATLLSDLPESFHPFVSHLAQTQMFSDFVNQCSSVSNSTRELLFFDWAIATCSSKKRPVKADSHRSLSDLGLSRDASPLSGNPGREVLVETKHQAFRLDALTEEFIQHALDPDLGSHVTVLTSRAGRAIQYDVSEPNLTLNVPSAEGLLPQDKPNVYVNFPRLDPTLIDQMVPGVQSSGASKHASMLSSLSLPADIGVLQDRGSRTPPLSPRLSMEAKAFDTPPAGSPRKSLQHAKTMTAPLEHESVPLKRSLSDAPSLDAFYNYQTTSHTNRIRRRSISAPNLKHRVLVSWVPDTVDPTRIVLKHLRDMREVLRETFQELAKPSPTPQQEMKVEAEHGAEPLLQEQLAHIYELWFLTNTAHASHRQVTLIGEKESRKKLSFRRDLLGMLIELHNMCEQGHRPSLTALRHVLVFAACFGDNVYHFHVLYSVFSLLDSDPGADFLRECALALREREARQCMENKSVRRQLQLATVQDNKYREQRHSITTDQRAPTLMKVKSSKKDLASMLPPLPSATLHRQRTTSQPDVEPLKYVLPDSVQTLARCTSCDYLLSGDEIVASWVQDYQRCTCCVCGSRVFPSLMLRFTTDDAEAMTKNWSSAFHEGVSVMKENPFFNLEERLSKHISEPEEPLKFAKPARARGSVSVSVTAPRITVNRAKQGPLGPTEFLLRVKLLSPSLLQAKYEVLVSSDSNEVLLNSHELLRNDPCLLWNLFWFFVTRGQFLGILNGGQLPFGFLFNPEIEFDAINYSYAVELKHLAPWSAHVKKSVPQSEAIPAAHPVYTQLTTEMKKNNLKAAVQIVLQQRQALLLQSSDGTITFDSVDEEVACVWFFRSLYKVLGKLAMPMSPTAAEAVAFHTRLGAILREVQSVDLGFSSMITQADYGPRKGVLQTVVLSRQVFGTKPLGADPDHAPINITPVKQYHNQLCEEASREVLGLPSLADLLRSHTFDHTLDQSNLYVKFSQFCSQMSGARAHLRYWELVQNFKHHWAQHGDDPDVHFLKNSANSITNEFVAGQGKAIIFSSEVKQGLLEAQKLWSDKCPAADVFDRSLGEVFAWLSNVYPMFVREFKTKFGLSGDQGSRRDALLEQLLEDR